MRPPNERPCYIPLLYHNKIDHQRPCSIMVVFLCLGFVWWCFGCCFICPGRLRFNCFHSKYVISIGIRARTVQWYFWLLQKRNEHPPYNAIINKCAEFIFLEFILYSVWHHNESITGIMYFICYITMRRSVNFLPLRRSFMTPHVILYSHNFIWSCYQIRVMSDMQSL